MLENLKIEALLVLGCVIFLSGCQTLPPNSLGTHDSARWENEVRALDSSVATNRPPAGSIIFLGSSSIKRWRTLATDFAGLPVYNRGFGGSQLADAVNYVDRIVIPFAPRQVVIYAGSNDLDAHKTPEMVYGDFVALVVKLRRALPRTRIAYISNAPNPCRWNEVEQTKRLNQLVETYCLRHKLDYINVFPMMLGTDSLPKPDIFVADKLHMNEKGYAIWCEAIEPYLR